MENERMNSNLAETKDLSTEISILRADVDELKKEGKGLLGKLKNAAIVVGFIGGVVALTEGSLGLYDRFAPATLLVEPPSRFTMQLDSTGRYLTVQTAVLLTNRREKATNLTGMHGAMWAERMGRDSVVHLPTVSLRRAGNAQSIPFAVGPNSETFDLEFGTDYTAEHERMLSKSGQFRFEITMIHDGKTSSASSCLDFGELGIIGLRMKTPVKTSSIPCEHRRNR